MPSSIHTALRFFALLLLLGCQGASLRGDLSPTGGAADARQVDWQRNLEDALAIAKAEGRPLLLAINMDGESASDRIVREEYRDPAFVAASRRYVCLAASLFRHNPRDYDDEGRRIPCPRLGGCTCGEHMALEPILFERFLSDGDRVAPRHVAILTDGKKAWDMSLSFDLKDIDRAVIATAETAPVARPKRVLSDWSRLAAARSAHGRSQLEAAIERAQDEASLGDALAAIAKHGDARSLDALRLFVPRLSGASRALQQRFVRSVRALSLGAPVAEAVRAHLQATPPFSSVEPAASGVWLRLVAELDPGGASSRAFLLASRAVGAPLAAETAKGVAQAIDASGGPFSLRTWLVEAERQRSAFAGAPSKPNPITDAMPTEPALLEELAQLDRERRARKGDVELRARVAKASLDLARRRLESGGSGTAALLIDAEAGFDAVLRQNPDRAGWWIERARAAYFRNAFDEERAHASAALRALTGKELGGVDFGEVASDGRAVEALRWIADANSRRFAGQVEAQPARAAASMRDALRAFAFVAISDYGDDGDWASFASFCGALGLRRHQLLVARAGALRFPGGTKIRQSLRQALWSVGGAKLGAPLADQIAFDVGSDHPGRADAEWFAGYAWLLQAEDERRRELPDAAVLSYAAATRRFEKTAQLRSDYAGNCAYYAAMCSLGAGLAHARAGRRSAAADALVAAVSRRAKLAAARDGLGYDVLDLVDKIFEWRAGGPSAVDPMRLSERIDAVGPATSFFAVAIADSQLREALRADGRSPIRAERETVDAAGQKIRMLMGQPNREGDAYLRASIRLLRQVKDRLSTEGDKKALAQADTIWAERQLERGRETGVLEALREAAELLDQDAPASSDRDELVRVAARLRSELGEARPRWRDGR